LAATDSLKRRHGQRKQSKTTRHKTKQ
jgi:hypothetical protein